MAKPSAKHADKFYTPEELAGRNPLMPRTKVKIPLIPWMLRIMHDIASGDENKNAQSRLEALMELMKRNPRRVVEYLYANDEDEIELIEKIMED